MAFIHGSNSAVFVNNTDFSSYFNNIDASRTAEVGETTTFGNDNKTFIPGS